MKFVFFDVDSETLLSKDGRVRPFMIDVLGYCYVSKVRVYLSGSTENVKKVIDWLQEQEGGKDQYIMGSFPKNGEIPHFPNLVISCNNEWLKKYPGLLVPPYDPDRSNRWADIAFAGRLLDIVKDKVVLGRFKHDEMTKPKKETPKDNGPEDPSNWAYTI